jgi:predicted transcriptional regulator
MAEQMDCSQVLRAGGLGGLQAAREVIKEICMTTDSSTLLRARAGEINLATPSGDAMRAVALQDRALDVMTDLRQRAPITVDSNVAIDQALRIMMLSGVRLVFVLDADSVLLGLVSSYDIQGEKPLRYLQSIGCTHKTCRREDIRVSDIMEPVHSWEVLSFADVCRATVSDVVSMFKRAGRSHLVVIEPADPPTQHVVRGLLSATQVARRLGVTIEVHGNALTFAEIEEALNDLHAPV